MSKEKVKIKQLNKELIGLGGHPIVLKDKKYKTPKIKDGYLVGKHGKKIGTKGDAYTKSIMHNILQNGCLDHNPRPNYEDFYKDAKYNLKKNIVITNDGKEISIAENDTVIEREDGVLIKVPAHTISINHGVECTYDLSKGESPLITLRPIAIKSSIAEILWIYQKASNDLVVFDELLGKNTWEKDHVIHNWWEQWALRYENGDYMLNDKGNPYNGACYGGTIQIHDDMFKNQVIESIRNNPDGRRHICSLWQVDDFKNPHALKPCAFMTIWNVRHGRDGIDYLDMTLIQRSSDFATAGCINQVQYATLLLMIAQELGIMPGMFTWKPINVHLYDRHIEQAITMLNRKPINCKAELKLTEGKGFYDITTNDVLVEDHPKELIKKDNPQLKFPLGI